MLQLGESKWRNQFPAIWVWFSLLPTDMGIVPSVFTLVYSPNEYSPDQHGTSKSKLLSEGWPGSFPSDGVLPLAYSGASNIVKHIFRDQNIRAQTRNGWAVEDGPLAEPETLPGLGASF